jgi:hypothetical protein
METGDRAEAEEEPAQKSKFGGEDRREEAQRWERRTQEDDRRRRRREDSEPRLFIACDDNQDPLESADKSGTPQNQQTHIHADINTKTHTKVNTHTHICYKTLSLLLTPIQSFQIYTSVKGQMVVSG